MQVFLHVMTLLPRPYLNLKRFTMSLPHKTEIRETFVPTVPLDATAARLYGLRASSQGSSATRPSRRPWWRHLMTGLL